MTTHSAPAEPCATSPRPPADVQVRVVAAPTPRARHHGASAPADSPPLPSFVQIEPVGQCNLRCRMCSIPYREDGPPFGPLAFMPFADYVRLVDGFPTLTELHLQGLGEPMMHPRFFDMVRYAADKGIAVSCNSNLSLLSEKRAAECVESGLSVLNVSLDAADPATYERIRLRGRFSKVIRNIDRVLAARLAAAGTSPDVRLVMVIMRDNLGELEPLIDLAAERGIVSIFVQALCHDFSEADLPAKYRPMRAFVEAQALQHHDEAEIERRFVAARQHASSCGVDLRLPEVRPRQHAPGTPGRTRCDWPWRGAYISYQGLAMPCCMVGTPDRANFGNMTVEGVPAIWSGDAYAAFRGALDSEEPPAVCRSCAIYNRTF